MQALSKRYWRIKYSLAISEVIYILLILFLFLNFGLSKKISISIFSLTGYKYIRVIIYLLVIYLIYSILIFPLDFFQSFILEHKFHLSNQKLIDWFKDWLKQKFIFYIISLILIEFFYFSLSYSPRYWWILISGFWILLSLILAKLIPIFILPLFFKYKRLNDEDLRERIIKLANRMKIALLDVFEIDLSKKTLKANAAFVGLGKSKRVLLADTLKGKYTPQEIELILAHEFSHYRLAHLLKLIFLEACLITSNFYIIYGTVGYFLKKYHLISLEDLASLPIIFIYFIIWAIVTSPLKNFISRIFEKNADILAIKITGLKEDFISLMEKISLQNLSDRNPPPIIKFFFFDHPPIDERIKLINKLDL
ncbi:MAG: M48 family metalloprotease [Candidatus Omnitrophica bacterium]|nr:M48 family metalloprotease [Candidatus Omnitrophota bacterium]